MISKSYNESYTVAITCCDRDVKYLDWALDLISYQTEIFEELIVSANGLPQSYFKDKPKEITVCGQKVPVLYISKPTRQNPGFCRNYAARHCKTKYIMFCDVDDASYPRRLEFAKKCIEKFDLDIFCHPQHASWENGSNNEYNDDGMLLNQTNASLAFTDFGKFATLCTYPSDLVCHKLETIYYEEQYNRVKGAFDALGVRLPSYFKDRRSNVCYGQIVVDVNKFMQTKIREDLLLGEDFEYLHRCINKGYKVRLLPTALIMHRLQKHSMDCKSYFKKKFLGEWEIKDYFREEYLKNRLDKNLEIYHNWDYENWQSDV